MSGPVGPTRPQARPQPPGGHRPSAAALQTSAEKAGGNGTGRRQQEGWAHSFGYCPAAAQVLPPHPG